MKVNYDNVSAIYDDRYKDSKMPGIEKKLLQIIEEKNYKKVLEAGCGTGHWIKKIPNLDFATGFDLSKGMLKKYPKPDSVSFVCTNADVLPLKNEQFDFIYCVNAIHHFTYPYQFIQNAYSKLKPGGMLAIFGTNPSEPIDNWYIFDYFDGVFETEVKRFPNTEKLKQCIVDSGFKENFFEIVDVVNREKTNYEIFDDLFLVKNATSELALISQEEYDLGINKMKAKIEENKLLNVDTKFNTYLNFYMIAGIK